MQKNYAAKKDAQIAVPAGFSAAGTLLHNQDQNMRSSDRQFSVLNRLYDTCFPTFIFERFVLPLFCVSQCYLYLPARKGGVSSLLFVRGAGQHTGQASGKRHQAQLRMEGETAGVDFGTLETFVDTFDIDPALLIVHLHIRSKKKASHVGKGVYLIAFCPSL